MGRLGGKRRRKVKYSMNYSVFKNTIDSRMLENTSRFFSTLELK